MLRRKITALVLCLVLNISLLPIETRAIPPENKVYDLIVIGGEPEGIAAAVSAARNGLETLLIEEGEVLGGLMTLGCLNFLDMSYGPQKELLTRGVFAEFYEEMGNAFDLHLAEQYFLRLVQKEENIDLKLGTTLVAPLLAENTLVGIKVNEKGKNNTYYGARFIDATTDADVAASSGVPYTIGAEDYGRPDETMGVTLVFRVKDVNWPYVFIYNNLMRLLSKIKSGWGDPYAGANWKVAWGYGEQALAYRPQDPLLRFRGPNLARQKDGTVLVNALLIFGVDSLDSASQKEALERGRAEIPHIITFMQEEFPGFARAKFVDTAQRLYVRETRHIQGEYRLTITDVLENRDHWDRIAHGSYPVDIQPTGPDNLGNVIGKPDIYSIPFRCLVPLMVENLLVVGRSASYDSLAHGSARVIPVGMATGEAAGVATAYSLEKELNFRELSKDKTAIKTVQEQLKKQGAYLVEYTPPRPKVMEHWAYPGVRVMRELGLAAGGYANDYKLDTAINYWDANYVFNEVTPGKAAFDFRTEITCGDLLVATVQTLTGQVVSAEEARAFLLEKEYLTKDEAQYFTLWKESPTFGQLYILGALLHKAHLAK
ncbi:MAG: FAD-dependent oxidoreductase [Clostridia bacterium]|nr:FAD-dependent oxidoreductase [Clostridia bacterium]